MRPALFVEVSDGAIEADSATTPAGDPCEHVVHRWHRGQARQFSGEILLEGLPGRLGATLKTRVHFIWKITYKNIRHACILLSTLRHRNHVRLIPITRITAMTAQGPFAPKTVLAQVANEPGVPSP